MPYPALSLSIIEYIKKVAEYNLSSLNVVLKSVLPIKDLFVAKHIEYYIQEYMDDQMLRSKIPAVISKSIPKLNDHQQHAFNDIQCILKQNQHQVTLLQGNTGSGKTELYLKLASDMIIDNPKAQILILLPEIFLGNQLLNRINNVFQVDTVCLWHSKVPNKQKRINIMNIMAGGANIIIGSRSAIFLPYRNLSLIIIDEEHDTSYKQGEGFVYNGRDMAILRAKYENIATILVSATPSIETIYNCNQGKYKNVNIESRFGSAGLPDIEIVDTRALSPYLSVSDHLKNVISNTLQKKTTSTFVFESQRLFTGLDVQRLQISFCMQKL